MTKIKSSVKVAKRHAEMATGVYKLEGSIGIEVMLKNGQSLTAETIEEMTVQLDNLLNNVDETVEEVKETTYKKFEVGKTYKLRLSSQACEFRYFECTDIKEGKVKGSFDGKKEKWYDIILTNKFVNGRISNDIECEALQPDKRVSNYVKANQIK